jgi:hypothetical protein
MIPVGERRSPSPRECNSPKVSYRMAARDWVWLGVALAALAYPILAAYIDGHK